MKKLISAFFMTVAMTGFLFAQGRKLSPELQNLTATQQEQVIVQFKTAAGDVNHRKITSRGGSLRFAYRRIKAGAYTVPASALANLSQDPDVVYISPDRVVRGTLDNSAAAVNAAAAWQLHLEGHGVGVAVIDSGITAVPDLQNTSAGLVYSEDFTGGNGRDMAHTSPASSPPTAEAQTAAIAPVRSKVSPQAHESLICAC
jgi:serine protease AprX